MKFKIHCGAYARWTGQPCKAKALTNGRCKNHGGLSTGPRTLEGRKSIGAATRLRMAAGQEERALKGFYRWLEAGSRAYLSKLGKARFLNKQQIKKFTNASRKCACASWSSKI